MDVPVYLDQIQLFRNSDNHECRDGRGNNYSDWTQELKFTLQDIGDDECWRFTWVGAYDEAEHGDSAVTCDDYVPGDMCFPPIIFTNNSETSGTPDLG